MLVSDVLPKSPEAMVDQVQLGRLCGLCRMRHHFQAARHAREVRADIATQYSIFLTRHQTNKALHGP